MAKEGFVGPGQGLGAGYVNFEPVRFVDERPTNWLNQHEASSRRGQARDSGNGQGKRGANEMQGR